MQTCGESSLQSLCDRVKNPPANAEAAGGSRSILGTERSPGEGNSNPLQCSCLGNPIDRGAWRGYRCRGCKESGTTVATEHLTPSTSLYMRCPPSRNALRFNARQHRNSPRHLLYLFSSPKGWKVKDEQNCAWPQWVIIWRRTTDM